MKKTLALVLTLCLLLSLPAFPAAAEESALTPATFSCYIELPTNCAIEGNDCLAWYQEKSNTTFDFVESTGDEMLPMLLNTGDYPEIIVKNAFSNDEHHFPSEILNMHIVQNASKNSYNRIL